MIITSPENNPVNNSYEFENLSTYPCSPLPTLLSTWSVPGTGWAHSVSIHPPEPCQEGRHTISILPMRKQWLDDVGNIFEFGFICLTPQSLILNYSKRFLSFPNFTGPKGERHMVWFRGYLEDCPSVLKIPLLQEGFSGKARTLGP